MHLPAAYRYANGAFNLAGASLCVRTRLQSAIIETESRSRRSKRLLSRLATIIDSDVEAVGGLANEFRSCLDIDVGAERDKPAIINKIPPRLTRCASPIVNGTESVSRKTTQKFHKCINRPRKSGSLPEEEGRREEDRTATP